MTSTKTSKLMFLKSLKPWIYPWKPSTNEKILAQKGGYKSFDSILKKINCNEQILYTMPCKSIHGLQTFQISSWCSWTNVGHYGGFCEADHYGEKNTRWFSKIFITELIFMFTICIWPQFPLNISNRSGSSCKAVYVNSLVPAVMRAKSTCLCWLKWTLKRTLIVFLVFLLLFLLSIHFWTTSPH